MSEIGISIIASSSTCAITLVHIANHPFIAAVIAMGTLLDDPNDSTVVSHVENNAVEIEDSRLLGFDRNQGNDVPVDDTLWCKYRFSRLQGGDASFDVLMLKVGNFARLHPSLCQAKAAHLRRIVEALQPRSLA